MHNTIYPLFNIKIDAIWRDKIAEKEQILGNEGKWMQMNIDKEINERKW